MNSDDSLRPTDAVESLTDAGISGRVVRTSNVLSVDFHVFQLHREGVTDNLVYRPHGFVGGVVRLPRIPKGTFADDPDTERAEIESRITSALPFTTGIHLQLKPELEGLVDNFDEYWYPHVNIEDKLTAQDAVLIAKNLKQNYTPPN